MQDHIPDALIAAFERQYDASWNDPQLRNERMAMRCGWAAAMEAKQCLHQIQEPAPATALDALREAEAALEVAIARILKANPGHSISVTSEAKALVAVRAALAATPAQSVVLPEQDAELLNQGIELLHALSCDERNRGNCSAAEGATASAYAVQRLASALLAGVSAPAAAKEGEQHAS